MVHLLALAAANSPLISQIFPPVPADEQLRNSPLLIYAVFYFSLGVAYLAIWRAATDFRFFRNMGAYLFLVGVQVITVYCHADAIDWVLVCIAAPFLVIIAGEAMRVPNRRWSLLVWPLCLAVIALGWFPWFLPYRMIAMDITEIFLCILVFQAFRSGQQRDRRLAVIFAILILIRWTVSDFFRAVTHLPRYIDIGGWRWSLNPIGILLLAIATLVIYVRDLIQDRREKQRLAAEFEAARTVQQMLFPKELPTVPGFAINGIYKPAGEVGGDFFQIRPLDNGAVLIVIGDVSGKGMPAAMTVSLLVGTFGTEANYTGRPAEILAAMNQRTLRHSCGGFTTCLVLRADADGTLTVANAGHIAPYLDGKELPLENALPLGLSVDATYTESTFEIAGNQQLTLITDGVVEARDPNGALFGFDRTAAISSQPADEIARAAQHFGQEDDISVVSLTRTSAPHLPSSEQLRPATRAATHASAS